MIRSNLFVLLLLFLFSGNAFSAAGCTSPVGKIGEMKYLPDDNDYVFCDSNLFWVSMNSGESTASNGNCSTAGMIVGNQFCNGTKLVNMNSQNHLMASGTCTTENMFKFKDDNMQICIGGLWYLSGECVSCGMAVGDACYTNYHGHKAACQADPNCEWDAANSQCKDLGSTGGGPGGGGSSI